MKKNQKGSVLVVVIVVFSVVLLLGTALLELTTVSHKQSVRTVDKKQSEYMAESGLEVVLNYIIDNLPDSSGILPTNLGEKFKSDLFTLKDASGSEWGVVIDIENTPNDEDIYKITSTATGTNTKRNIKGDASVLIKGEKDTMPLPIGGTDTINFVSNGSIVGIQNGGMFSKESIEFNNVNDEQALQLEYVITLGDIKSNSSSLRIDIGKIYAGGSINLNATNQIKVGQMEAVGDIFLNQIANSYKPGTSIQLDDSYVDIDKVYTNGSIQLKEMQPEKRPIKMGEVVAVNNAEISGNQRHAQIGDIRVGGEFKYNDIYIIPQATEPIKDAKIQNIVAKGNIDIETANRKLLGETIVSDKNVNLSATRKPWNEGGIFFNKLQMTAGTFQSQGVDINKEIIANENAPTIPTREDSWVGQDDGAITTSTLLDSYGNPYQVPIWVEDVIQRSEQQKITMYNKMCQLVDMDPTSVMIPMNERIDMQSRIAEWNMTEGRVFIDDRDTVPEPKPDPTQTITIIGDNVDGEFPMNIYHPKGKVIFENFGSTTNNTSVTFTGTIVAREIEIRNSHSINFNLGGPAGGGSASTGNYNDFKIIKYEK
ncbi:MAG: hypothetical protein ACRCSG_08290 [Cellulosilyticaceae bacterium]